jgi:hypothetical protein
MSEPINRNKTPLIKERKGSVYIFRKQILLKNSINTLDSESLQGMTNQFHFEELVSGNENP